jgi:hypothetical protein
MSRMAALGLLVCLVTFGSLRTGPAPGAGAHVATPAPLVLTDLGHALRVGPATAGHFVGLLANGSGAIGIAIAPNGTFLAHTCGMRPQADAWFNGDWYRGRLVKGEAAEPTVSEADGDELHLAQGADGVITGTVRSPAGEQLPITVTEAAAEDGLFRRDDADGVLGAVALPGNTVCADKRTSDGDLIPAGTVPY